MDNLLVNNYFPLLQHGVTSCPPVGVILDILLSSTRTLTSNDEDSNISLSRATIGRPMALGFLDARSPTFQVSINTVTSQARVLSTTRVDKYPDVHIDGLFVKFSMIQLPSVLKISTSPESLKPNSMAFTFQSYPGTLHGRHGSPCGLLFGRTTQSRIDDHLQVSHGHSWRIPCLGSCDLVVGVAYCNKLTNI
jgi:hypothetical protein